MSDPTPHVTAIYKAILRREPTPAELAQANAKLSDDGKLLDIVDSLCRSKEAERYKARLFVPPGHFYSPICDPEILRDIIPRVRKPVERKLPDVALDIDKMTRFWTKSLRPATQSVAFPESPDPAFRFHFENPAYSYGDAIILSAMIVYLRPRRIIEVGSGWSSACMLDTVTRVPELNTHITFVEPYPELLKKNMRPEDSERTTIISTGVQQVPLEEFERLERNDILFIDSTHVVKTGSDVVHELTEVLPRLKPGVMIHFHDIFYPFEYGWNWAIEQNRSWNEIYALRSFLAFNSHFEIVFFNDMFAQLRREYLERDCPAILKNTGGAIWIQRVNNEAA